MYIECNTEDFIGDVELLEREYKQCNKKEVYKVSNWNADPHLSAKMIELCDATNDINSLDYILPYEIDEKLKRGVINKICGSEVNKHKDILFTTSGTVSIYSVINALKQHKNNRIAIIGPAYFSVTFACKNLGIEYALFFLKRSNKGYYMEDNDKCKIKEYNVIWFTNPIYCTGVYYGKRELALFRELLEMGITIIFDESLALWGEELIRDYKDYNNAISICSPHKSICFNSMKFSCIIADKEFVSEMEHWSDIISGCISWSNYKAIYHFLSDNYRMEKEVFLKDTQLGYQRVVDVCRKNKIDYDKDVKGCFMTLYFSDIRFDLLDDYNNLKNLIMKAGVSIIMGSRNYFSTDIGLTIRVNLTNITEAKVAKIIEMINIIKEIESTSKWASGSVRGYVNY